MADEAAATNPVPMPEPVSPDLSTPDAADLHALQAQILASLGEAPDAAALDAVRVGALGKKGSISALLATLGKMDPEERKTRGAAINRLKEAVLSALDARRDVLREAALEARLKAEVVDVTLPTRPGPLETGRVHPITQVTDEVAAIFADMGFSIAEGPDIETDDYNFTKLNFPPDHPRGTCTTRSSFRRGLTARASCSAPTRARCRCAPCWRSSRRSGSSAPAAPTAAIQTRRTRRCSTR